MTPLVIAQYKGHMEMLKFLIEKGAKINTTTEDGYTPLMHAVRKGRPDVVESLVNLGADVTVESDADAETALTLTREELALITSVQSSEMLSGKTRFLTEEKIKATIEVDDPLTSLRPADWISIIETTCPDEEFTDEEKEEIRNISKENFQMENHRKKSSCSWGVRYRKHKEQKD